MLTGFSAEALRSGKMVRCLPVLPRMSEIRNPQLLKLADTCVVCGLCIAAMSYLRCCRPGRFAARPHCADAWRAGQAAADRALCQHLICLTCCHLRLKGLPESGAVWQAGRRHACRKSCQTESAAAATLAAGLACVCWHAVPAANAIVAYTHVWPGGVGLASRLLRRPQLAPNPREMAGGAQSVAGETIGTWGLGEVQLFLGCVARHAGRRGDRCNHPPATRLRFAVRCHAGQQCCGALLDAMPAPLLPADKLLRGNLRARWRQCADIGIGVRLWCRSARCQVRVWSTR